MGPWGLGFKGNTCFLFLLSGLFVVGPPQRQPRQASKRVNPRPPPQKQQKQLPRPNRTTRSCPNRKKSSARPNSKKHTLPRRPAQTAKQQHAPSPNTTKQTRPLPGPPRQQNKTCPLPDPPKLQKQQKGPKQEKTHPFPARPNRKINAPLAPTP